MAPYSRRAMHLLEYGGVEKAFYQPSEMFRQSPALVPLFAHNLQTRMTGDETEAEVQSLLGSSPSQSVGTVVGMSSVQLKEENAITVKNEADEGVIDPGKEEPAGVFPINGGEQNGSASGVI